jgi:hypothetical protein
MRTQKPPDNEEDLVRILGLSDEHLKGLREKHGGQLLAVLKTMWRKTRHQPRLLARDSTRGYTNEPAVAMTREPEAVGEEEQRMMTADVHAREGDTETLAQLQREQHTLPERLNEIRAAAKREKIDRNSDERVIKQRMRAIEKRLRNARGIR